MRFRNVGIAGMASIIPPHEMTSGEIERRLEPAYSRLRLLEGRLELMTGIQKRHFFDPGTLPSDASAQAGEKLFHETGFDRSQIDMLIHCGVCRDRLEPATAAYVHGLLGLSSRCQFMDISNACLGFLNAMVMAGSMIESGQIRHALLVSGEDGRPLLERTIRTLNEGHLSRSDIKPYFANLTIGAGGVAMILAHRNWLPSHAPKLYGGTVAADSEANKLCQGDHSEGDSLDMLTEAEELLEAGLVLARKNWNHFLKETYWNQESIDRYICHQVGRTHQRKLFEALGIDPAKDFTTYEYMGNVGSVSLPFTLERAVAEGEIGHGNRVALLGIGSGLSSIMLGVDF